jgi:hypothetical protein
MEVKLHIALHILTFKDYILKFKKCENKILEVANDIY